VVKNVLSEYLCFSFLLRYLSSRTRLFSTQFPEDEKNAKSSGCVKFVLFRGRQIIVTKKNLFALKLFKPWSHLIFDPIVEYIRIIVEYIRKHPDAVALYR